ncbi:MAG: hypothetical protein B5766_01250 [Candidatus Lumbricidophila eiseniae]|uniref:Uncharacterized protein n=1 Tax=Candidatus Lumbricidiphila eiseniae TaxID=1969409 RepID=A0A2A6FUQ3_9MICO|nr:MAG: hypothetical protein B5766_01250 [Candidatus Lumbricidophila eiseniae]
MPRRGTPTAPRVLTKKAPAQLRGAAPVARKNFVTPARVLAVQAFGHYLGSDNQRSTAPPRLVDAPDFAKSVGF